MDNNPYKTHVNLHHFKMKKIYHKTKQKNGNFRLGFLTGLFGAGFGTSLERSDPVQNSPDPQH
jgi:hypothetical protein